jgi:hypothetical protein
LSDKPLRDYRWIETKVEKYFNQFYENQNNIKLYQGIKYIAYDKEYTEERLDADDYEELKDEIDEVEKFFKININVYIQDEITKDKKGKDIGLTNIDRKSMTDYETTLNLMRYDNHFMYIKDMDLMRHCYKCKTCSKCFNNMYDCHRHESKCDSKKQFIKHEFIGGSYNKHQSIFEKIFKLYNKKDKTNKKKKIMRQETLNHFGLTEDDLFYPHEIAFDFEAILQKIKSDSDKKLQFTTSHIPVSVSILSNVDGFNTKPRKNGQKKWLNGPLCRQRNLNPFDNRRPHQTT